MINPKDLYLSFVVLINGVASDFFYAKRGLRQGYPLSPLLFMLIMEGLIRLISNLKRRGTLKGAHILGEIFLTHLLFIDDFFYLS